MLNNKHVTVSLISSRINANYFCFQQNAVEKVRGLDLITRNFLQMNLVFEQPNAQIISDKPVMTIDNLLSSVGGALSLWLGVTLMFVFEVIELTFSIIGNWYCSRWKLSSRDSV